MDNTYDYNNTNQNGETPEVENTPVQENTAGTDAYASQPEQTVSQKATAQQETVQPDYTQQSTDTQQTYTYTWQGNGQQTYNNQQTAYQGDYTYQWQGNQSQSGAYVVNDQTSGSSQKKPKKAKKLKEKKEKSTRTPWGAMIALALVCAILGGGIGAAVTTLVATDGSVISASSGTDSSSSETVINSGSHTTAVVLNEVESGEEMTAAEVYANNVNSTVGITTSITTNYWGYTTTSAASGSGFIISSDGYILTNYHVVEDSDSITVSLYNGETYSATLVGYDESNDIAVLKIDATDLEAVTLGDSDSLNVGDSVVAIGNPLGELTFSLTSGIVSALDRSVTLSTGTTMELIQTDCAINSGNSGGALFNMYGEVVGITNAKYSSSSSSEASIDNIGFAIPINTVKEIVYSIIETGTYEKSYIGVTVTDVTTSVYYSTGLTSGAVVYSVTEGAPADEAGLEVGDVITKADDTEITGASSLSTYVGSLEVGDELVLEVYRDGETRVIVVTVGSTTQSALPDSDTTESDSGIDSDSGSNSGSDSQSGNSSSPWGDMFGNFGFGSGNSNSNSGNDSNGNSNSDGIV